MIILESDNGIGKCKGLNKVRDAKRKREKGAKRIIKSEIHINQNVNKRNSRGRYLKRESQEDGFLGRQEEQRERKVEKQIMKSKEKDRQRDRQREREREREIDRQRERESEKERERGEKDSERWRERQWDR